VGAGRRAYISGLEGLGDVGKASAWKEIALDVGDGQALDGEQVTLHTVDGRGTIDQHDLCCKSQNKKNTVTSHRESAVTNTTILRTNTTILRSAGPAVIQKLRIGCLNLLVGCFPLVPAESASMIKEIFVMLDKGVLSLHK